MKGVIGIIMICAGLLFGIKGYEMMDFSKAMLDYPFSAFPNLNSYNSNFNIIPVYINWLNGMDIHRNPDTDIYRLNQSVHFQFYFSSTIHAEEATIHVFHSDLKDIFFTSIRPNSMNLPRFSNERVFFYNFNSSSSSCNNQNNQTNLGNCTYDYNGYINHEFTVPGTYYADFSLRQGKTIYEYKNPIPLLRVIEPSDDWLINSTAYILGESYKQPFEKYNSDGLAVFGIGVGIFLSGVPFFASYLEDRGSKKRTIDLAIRDFRTVNDAVVETSNNLKMFLANSKSKSDFVTNLLSNKTTPSSLLGKYYRALFLPLWESVSIHLREFDERDQEALRMLRIFIETSNHTMINQYHILSNKLNEILISSDTKSVKESNLMQSLQQGLAISLRDYESIYSIINEKLAKIDWINRDGWNKID